MTITLEKREFPRIGWRHKLRETLWILAIFGRLLLLPLQTQAQPDRPPEPFHVVVFTPTTEGNTYWSEVHSVMRSAAGAQNGDTREYPLLYEYDGTEREIGTLQAIVRAVDNRILAIALVHQKLYHGGNLSHIDMKEYLEQLALEIRLSYHREYLQIELQTDIEELSMLIDTAIPCGMIRVALNRTGEELYLLTVADDGIGVDSSFDPRRDGALGMQSVVAIVETQLREQGERLRHSRYSRAVLT